MTTTKEKNIKEGAFLTCKLDAMFKTVFMNEKNPKLLEAVLSCILGGKPHIISWPTTYIPNTLAKEKAKTRDLVVELDGTYINLEVETGYGIETRCQLFTYHASMWKQNILVGNKYDIKTMFLQIVLQFGLSPHRSLIREYKMQSIDEETKEISVWVENFKTIEVNMERLKEMWYTKSSKDIDKYKYLMMIDMNEQELAYLQEIRGKDDIVEEYADKVGRLNKNPNFINTIGKEKEREYMFNTAVEVAREQGIEQGLEQGVKKGIEQTRIENAKSLIAAGVDRDIVIDTLKLTEDEKKELI